MIAFMLECGALCSFAHVIAVHTVFDFVFSSVSVPSPVPPPPFCFLFALLRVFQRLSLALALSFSLSIAHANASDGSSLVTQTPNLRSLSAFVGCCPRSLHRCPGRTFLSSGVSSGRVIEEQEEVEEE